MRFTLLCAVPRHLRALCNLVLLLTAVPFAHAAEVTLTLSEAQWRAVERSRQLSAQDSAVTASREMAAAAGQLPDPVFKLGIQDLPVNGPDRFSVERDSFTMRQQSVRRGDGSRRESVT